MSMRWEAHGIQHAHTQQTSRWQQEERDREEIGRQEGRRLGAAEMTYDGDQGGRKLGTLGGQCGRSNLGGGDGMLSVVDANDAG